MDKIEITEVKTTFTICKPAIAVTFAKIARNVDGTPSSSLLNKFIFYPFSFIKNKAF